MGFTKNPENVGAAKVFAAWCNAAGGINGRKIVPVTRDAAFFADAQQTLASCQSDFAIVGGSAGWMKERSSRLASLIAVPQSGLSGARPRPK